jgi:integrase
VTQWNQWCDDQLAQLNHDLKELKKGGKFVQTRDPFIPIKEFIERDHPLTVMIELAQSIAEYLRSHPMLKPSARLATERTLFLVELLTEQPLRLKMLYIMTYLDDNTGNLYRRANGSWALRFPKEAFKNERGAAQKPYDVPFSEYLSARINDYLLRILTKIPNRGDRVFPCVKPVKKGTRTRSTSLEHAFRNATRRFVKGCKGFGPHAVRHIVATDYIKNNESGWQTAADVLHDTIETIRKAYAFLRAEDGHKFYRDYVTKLRANHPKETKYKGVAAAGEERGE